MNFHKTRMLPSQRFWFAWSGVGPDGEIVYKLPGEADVQAGRRAGCGVCAYTASAASSANPHVVGKAVMSLPQTPAAQGGANATKRLCPQPAPQGGARIPGLYLGWI